MGRYGRGAKRSMKLAMILATRTGKASLLVVSRAVKEGTAALRTLALALNHQLQLKNPQHHPYPPPYPQQLLWCDACDMSMTPVMSSYTHGPTFITGGE